MKLSDVILYKRGKDAAEGGPPPRRLVVLHYTYIGVMLFFMGIGIGLVSLLLGSPFPGNSGNSMFVSYLREPLILLLNLLPCLLLVAGLYFATGRAWAAFLGSAGLIFVLSLIHYYKIDIRGESFVASDLAVAGEALGVISGYKLAVSARVLAVIGSFIFGLAYAIFLMRGVLRRGSARIIGAVVSFAALAVLLCTVYPSADVYKKAQNNTAIYSIWVEQQVFASKGFLYSFLHSIPDVIQTPPEGYDKGEAEALLSHYEDGIIEESRRVNVISVMFEAFADLSEYPEVPVYDEVYEAFHDLQAESLSGRLISNYFGGGTINSERNFLTGYTEAESYPRPTNSYIYFFRQNGYYAEGYHSGDGWFYDRQNVERNLGMQAFYFLEDFNITERSDQLFFEKLTELYEARDKSVPYFNFSVTFQNHGGYESASTGETAYLSHEGLSDATYNALNNYFAGVADTVRRMTDFVDSLRDDPEPVVVVFFGDHMPSLAAQLRELKVNLDLGTEEGFFNYYSTPYIIWANDAAREATGGSFTGDGGDVSACFLMDMLFDECGWGKSAFMQLNHELRGLTTIVHEFYPVYCIDGRFTREFSDEAADFLKAFQYAEYYMKNEFAYGSLYGDQEERLAGENLR